MSELVPYQQSVPAVDFQSRAVARLGEWAQSADAAYTVAQRLVQSSFVPTAFRGKPIEACAAILAGSEVGLSPMSSLRAFDVIQGQAAPRAITLRAVVQSYGHEMVLVESTATRCRMKGRRRGSDEWQQVSWTIDRAKDLGLTSKDGWKKQPTAMLLARATSELARLIAADAILGIGYTVEELADGGSEPVTVPVEADTEAGASGRRRMSRPKTDAVPEPEPEPVEADEPTLPVGESAPDADEPPKITDRQLGQLHVLFGEAGITERDARLDYCRNLLGRDLETSKDLTKGEASRVIDALKSDTDS